MTVIDIYQDTYRIFKRKIGHSSSLLGIFLLLVSILSLDMSQAQKVSHRLLGPGSVSTPSLRVVALKVNERASVAKSFVGNSRPGFSWEVTVKNRGNAAGRQLSAYQLLVGTRQGLKAALHSINVPGDAANTSKNVSIYWNSGKQTTGDLLHTIYNGQKTLRSDRVYYWAVRVWDGDGQCSAWSQIDSFQTALFERKDFLGASWIGRNQMRPSERILPGDTAIYITGPDGKKKKLPFGTINDTLPLFRKPFKLQRKANQIRRATLFISGLGQFEARLNGKKIGDHFLDPGWTNYQLSALYVGLDATKQLIEGVNVLGVSLGNGFYYIPGQKNWYKKLLVQYGYPKMICRLSIHYLDGSSQNIVSDTSWETGPSAIRFSSIYGGELTDGTKKYAGWDQPGFDPGKNGWRPAISVTDTPARLTLQTIDPIKVMKKFGVQAVYPAWKANEKQAATDHWTYDMGQNCAGIPYLEISGKKGDTIRLLPGELMRGDHRVSQKATGKYQLIYVLKKDGLQSWHPKFTYYGYRYIELQGGVPKGKPNPEGKPVVKLMQSWHIRNSAPEAGHFSCSNELFNQTNTLIKWAIKSNMMSLFTDCPHREKLGWLEQLHLMGSSVRYNYQIHHLLTKSLTDMREAQTKQGLIPEIAPEYTVFTWGGDMFRDSPEWGSSAIIVPWYLYSWYGDRAALKNNYQMMTRYYAYLKSKTKGHLLYQGLGDWYDLGPKPPGTSQLTPKGLTASAIYYYDLQILANTAGLLGKQADRQKFIREAELVKQAFNQSFLHRGVDTLGQRTAYYGTGSQTADAMALYMHLVPEDLHEQVVDHLVTGIVQNHYALTAGDIGYRYLLRVLEAEGYSELIFKMNNQRDMPGYGYQISRGATALTESWQALPSVSNNHFMLGHLMEWFYSGLLGIRLDFASAARTGKPALVIAPEMVGDLSWAKGDYLTPYGWVKVHWQKKTSLTQLKLQVPVGLTAQLRLPYVPGADYRENPGGAATKEQLKWQERTLQGKKYVETTVSSGEHVYTIQLKH